MNSIKIIISPEEVYEIFVEHDDFMAAREELRAMGSKYLKLYNEQLTPFEPTAEYHAPEINP